MKLGKKNMLLLSFMLFSLFFGAGNLIFPPFLGQNAGSNMPLAIAGFLVTAVVLPVLGVIVIAKFDGLEKLGQKVNPAFAIVFTILIYLSIGPGLGIPRAASVPFEMAIAPYLSENISAGWMMLAYSTVFFLLAGWFAMTPSKLMERIGKFLTPSLLTLLVFVFISFLFRGDAVVEAPQAAYASGAMVKGFLEGYQTMDAIAALNFGFVIAATLKGLNVNENHQIVKHTVHAGIIAGSILTMVYLMLSYMGMMSSGVYSIQDNGAWTLRCIVSQLFGHPGAVLLASIFTLACLTTCIGLITSIAQFFAKLTKKVSYRSWVFIIVGFSFLVCNQGLNTILSISVPVLDMIYPVSIVLVLLGLFDSKLKNNPYVYPATIAVTGVVSVVYSLNNMNVPLGFVTDLFSALPFFSMGMGWVTAALATVVVCMAVYAVKQKSTAPAKEMA